MAQYSTYYDERHGRIQKISPRDGGGVGWGPSPTDKNNSDIVSSLVINLFYREV